ncbi:MAG: DUF2029 domain-containing protein [Nitrospirales bacterium]|nr:DUF2029 domain-containing protein [Nitrospirales bacterium]
MKVLHADKTHSVPTLTHLALVLLGGLLLALYLIGEGQRPPEFPSFITLALGQATLYLVAVWLVLRGRSSRSLLIIILLFAVLFRLSILFSPPPFSSDVYRYIWDGRVQAAGINPYRYLPSDPDLALLRDQQIYPNINRRDTAHTIYPPVAQAIYFAVTRVSESVTWMKAVMVGCEALTIWALLALLARMGLPQERVLILAWHPLFVWEFAGNGHVDAIAGAFISLALLARYRRWDTGVGLALGCATLVKFLPVIVFPALYRRWGWKMPVAFAITIGLAYLPYLSVGTRVVGFLPGYAGEEGLISGTRFFIFDVARRIIPGWDVSAESFIALAFSILFGLAMWSLRTRDPSPRDFILRGLLLASAFTILFSPHYPWYFAWLVPFLCIMPFVPLLYLTATSFVLYGMWMGETPELMFALNLFLYLPFAIVCILALWNRRWNFDRAGEATFASQWLEVQTDAFAPNSDAAGYVEQTAFTRDGGEK